jgi:hypothetical protein
MRKFYLMLLVTILCLMAGGCGFRVLIPDLLLVKKAIALEVTLDQKQVSQQLLRSETVPKFELGRVTISQIEPMIIQNLESYRITGNYDLTVELPRQNWKLKGNPFEVYLQRQQQGQTWRLARPQIKSKNSDVKWFTYLIR